MDALVVLTAVAITSGAAYVVAQRTLGLERRALAGAALRTLECLGITAAFLILNTLVGMALALGLRGMTAWFIPLYAASDVVLVPLSLAQGLVLWWWRAASSAPRRE